MITVCQAPTGIDGSLPRPYVFMAGGINNCPDWQTEFIHAATQSDRSLTLFNPRRENFPINDPRASCEQIQWEYNALRLADSILFWFSRGSDNPIVFFEYGRHLCKAAEGRIVVGCDPEFRRKADVEIQTHLAFPGLRIHDNLRSLLTNLFTSVWGRGE